MCCQVRESSVQDRGFFGTFIGPRRYISECFGVPSERGPTETVGSGARMGSGIGGGSGQLESIEGPGGLRHSPGPALVLPHTVQCAPDGRDCLAQGRADFEAYRRVKLQAIRDKSQGYRLPSAPVAFIHPKRTEYSVLPVHGLNDSAYYMADLGEFLYRKGFNVITVLLPGHRTDTRDMLDVTAEQWRAEVDLGLGMASLVGRKIILGGFSLGAAWPSTRCCGTGKYTDSSCFLPPSGSALSPPFPPWRVPRSCALTCTRPTCRRTPLSTNTAWATAYASSPV